MLNVVTWNIAAINNNPFEYAECNHAPSNEPPYQGLEPAVYVRRYTPIRASQVLDHA